MKPSAGLRTWHCFGLLFVAVFGAYLNCLGNGLVDFDDTVILHPSGIFGTAVVKRLAEDFRKDPLNALPKLITSRPLTGLTHTVANALFGKDYWGHHLANVALHFLACCFAFLVAAELLGSRTGGLAGALVFALHPVQTESVAYLAGRRDVLCGLLSLASLYLWLRGLRTGHRAATAGAVAVWALAMTAKSSAITVPLLWLAASASTKPEEIKEHLRRNAKLYIGSAAACAAVLLAHLQLEGKTSERFQLPAELSWYGESPAAQWATQPRIVMHALKLLLWPVTLSADYSLQVFAPSRSFLEPKVLLAMAGLGGLLWLAWALRRRRPQVSFALTWIAVTYAPMLHILPALHNNEVFAEHWLYLPLFGFALLMGSLLGNARRFPKVYWTGFGLLLCLYAGRTVIRNRDWKDALTLWSKTVATYPQCGRAQGILGMVHLNRGHMTAAEPPLLRALELRPDDLKHHINLAVVYRNTGRHKEAELVLREALKSPLAAPLQKDLYYNLDLVYAQSGRFPLMRRPWDRFNKIDYAPPFWNITALNLAGKSAAASGRADMAERIYVRTMAKTSNPSAALYNLGMLYYTLGRFELAALGFERLLKYQPAHLQARIYLGLSYAEVSAAPRARRALDEALKAAPRSVEVWLAFSSFHLQRKEFARALAAARQAARLEKSPRTSRQLYLVYRES